MSQPQSLKEVINALREFSHLVNITVTKGNVAVIQKNRFLSDADYGEIMDIVRNMGGNYNSEARSFEVPIANPPTPASAPSLSGQKPLLGLPDFGEFKIIPISKLLNAAVKVRQTIDEEFIVRLIENMREYGIIESLVVRPKSEGFYEVVIGDTRLTAARQVPGLQEMPCFIRPLNDRQAYELGLTENITRHDLTAYDIAKALHHLLKTYPDEYPSQRILAYKLSVDEDWLSSHLAIMEYEGKIDARRLGEMTHVQARELRRLPDEKQEEILRTITQKDHMPSTRQMAKPPRGEAPEGAFREEDWLLGGEEPLGETAKEEEEGREKAKEEKAEEADAVGENEVEQTVQEFDCPVCKKHRAIKCDGVMCWVE